MNSDYQDFKYKELTERIYENAMMIKFRREGIPAVAQFPIPELKRKAFGNLRK